MSKMKRSRHLALTTLMATAAVNLTACGPQAPAAVTWDTPAAPAAAAQDEAVDAVSYSDPLACKVADQVSDGECDQAWRTAQADHEAKGPRFGDKAACEAEYGQGNCETRSSAGGGSFFMPFLAGMMLGQISSGRRGYYGGTGYYRDSRGRFSTPYGGAGSVFRNPSTGALQMTRSAVDPSSSFRQAPYQAGRGGRAVSRGGFSNTRSYTGGRGYGG
jgi:uncharacterized protein YgiB involved in biofilm formation